MKTACFTETMVRKFVDRTPISELDELRVFCTNVFHTRLVKNAVDGDCAYHFLAVFSISRGFRRNCSCFNNYYQFYV